LAEHGGKISDGPEIGVNGAAFTLDGGLLDLQVGKGLRLRGAWRWATCSR